LLGRTRYLNIPHWLIVFPSLLFITTLIVGSIGVVYRSALFLRIEVYIQSKYNTYKRRFVSKPIGARSSRSLKVSACVLVFLAISWLFACFSTLCTKLETLSEKLFETRRLAIPHYLAGPLQSSAIRVN